MRNFKELSELILNLAYSHNMVYSTGFSHQIDISNIRTDQLPLFYLTPNRIVIDKTTTTYYYTFFGLDQLRKGDVNGMECFSDMAGVLNDIVFYLDANYYQVVYTAEGDAIFEDYDASLRGWSLSVGIIVPNDEDCYSGSNFNELNFE